MNLHASHSEISSGSMSASRACRPSMKAPAPAGASAVQAAAIWLPHCGVSGSEFVPADRSAAAAVGLLLARAGLLRSAECWGCWGCGWPAATHGQWVVGHDGQPEGQHSLSSPFSACRVHLFLKPGSLGTFNRILISAICVSVFF